MAQHHLLRQPQAFFEPIQVAQAVAKRKTSGPSAAGKIQGDNPEPVVTENPKESEQPEAASRTWSLSSRERELLTQPPPDSSSAGRNLFKQQMREVVRGLCTRAGAVRNVSHTLPLAFRSATAILVLTQIKRHVGSNHFKSRKIRLGVDLLGHMTLEHLIVFFQKLFKGEQPCLGIENVSFCTGHY